MRICYVDEAGCTGRLPSDGSDIQPVFVLGAVDFAASDLSRFTHDFLHLKRRFFPNLPVEGGLYLGWILAEVKGSDVRRQAISRSRRRSRHALGFLHEIVRLLERYRAGIHGRVWVKAPEEQFNGRSVYTFSLQHICQSFQQRLTTDCSAGIIVCDSRNKALNTIASHSVFTQKFRAAGDRYPNILEMPSFGHSENHAGVQIADLVCSALLFPMAIDSYCRSRLSGAHVRDYSVLRDRFGERLEALQTRWHDEKTRRTLGGVNVDDKIGKRVRSLMFSSTAGASLGVVLPKPREQSVAEGDRGGTESPHRG
jgi:hypothetical protein